jgi:hypothetical protein
LEIRKDWIIFLHPILKASKSSTLRPQYTRTFELAYKKKWDSGTMFIAGFYRSIDNIYSRIYTVDAQASTSIINIIPQNPGKGINVGFESPLNKILKNPTSELRSWVNKVFRKFHLLGLNE